MTASLPPMQNALPGPAPQSVRSCPPRFCDWTRGWPLLCALLLVLGVGIPRAIGQDMGGDEAAPQQAPITPAGGIPSENSGPAQPIFSEPASPVTPSSRPVPAGGVPSVSSTLGGLGLGSGPIRAGDIVDVHFFGASQYDIRMPVASSGDIAIPYAGVFHIDGMTSIEAATAISKLFADRQLLHDPHVIVTTQQFGDSVTVLGEVRIPGIYQLSGRHRLIDILTEAGGITNNAGHGIEIFDQSMTNPQQVVWDPTLKENNNASILLKAGNTVLVSRCGVVYVGGNVNRPGAFPLCDSNHTTLSEVMTLAQGTKPSSWSQRTLLLRSSGNGTRVVETIKLESVLRGKGVDVTMQPDDIVFVPPSALKAGSKIAITSAIGFATQAYFYLR
ncbi:MAG TPA: SLBB domain-containing protein [Acidobacteriaceae bacterium]|nr:SLBB domain-containing protein [Acidobacteriaceae bacterium]